MHLREHELYRVCDVEHGVEHGALRPVPLPVHSCIWSAGLASSCPLTSVHLSPCHLPPGICLFIHPLPIHPSSLCSPRAPLIQPSMHLRSHHLAVGSHVCGDSTEYVGATRAYISAHIVGVGPDPLPRPVTLPLPPHLESYPREGTGPSLGSLPWPWLPSEASVES